MPSQTLQDFPARCREHFLQVTPVPIHNKMAGTASLEMERKPNFFQSGVHFHSKTKFSPQKMLFSFPVESLPDMANSVQLPRISPFRVENIEVQS